MGENGGTAKLRPVSDQLTAELGELAESHGAAAFGIAGAAPFQRELVTLRSHKEAGRSARLGFTYGDPSLATDVTRSFGWAKRIVVVGWNYLEASVGPAPTGAVVGRFATGDHYQDLRGVTASLSAHLRRLGYRAEELMDDNRLVDRAAAVRAGIGWWGKSTMVLAPGHGPWLLLGSVVTDAPLTTTRPMQRGCGTCVACFPACPTGALGADGLDARRCLSTWLQTPGSIPHWIRPLLGRRVYGCDDCLTSCPPGKRSLASAGERLEAMPFAQLLELSDADLIERFSWWFVPRRDGRFIRRNLLIAAGNSGEPEARHALAGHLSHRSSMIRGHAAWALARGFGAVGLQLLRTSFASETVPEARDELALALLMAERPDAHRDVLVFDELVGTEETLRALALMDDRDVSERLQLLVLYTGSEPNLVRHEGIDIEYVSVDHVEIDQPFIAVYDPDRRLEATRRGLRSRSVSGGSAV